ncbi:MAG: hypothetical protein WAV05_02950 [Anaerolineales bacterium]
MIASAADFQLITTFNKWDEGTSVESSDEWASQSGYGAYLDSLHNDGLVTVYTWYLPIVKGGSITGGDPVVVTKGGIVSCGSPNTIYISLLAPTNVWFWHARK